jgi:putative transcriptional regulator
MKLQAGTIIKSTDALNETVFDGVTILITEYNGKGAVGFIVNKPFLRKLNELEEFKHSPAVPLYDGGPVDQEHLFFIHRRTDLIRDAIHVGDDIYVGGSFKDAIRFINNNTLTQKDIKIFIGYCGWNAVELEAEIEEGSWTIGSEDVFMV